MSSLIVSDKILNDVEFYCVSYNSPEREKTMKDRFARFGIPLHVHGVQHDDPRLDGTDDMSHIRLASCFYGHVDNLRNFYNTGKKYGFTCEDDVHIHKEFGALLPKIIEHFEEMKLDILLLGYMISYPIKDWHSGYYFIYPYDPMRKYQYHHYPDNQWGIHLAMVSRDYAKKVIETFDETYAKRTIIDKTLAPCNPDWCITKLTKNRGLIYPMVAVEDGKGKYEHYGQGEFHRKSHLANFIPDMFW